MTSQIGIASRAPRHVTVFTPIARFLLARGVPLGPNGLLTVRGRTSGAPRSAPIAIIRADGRRWIWAPWGDVHWVRNLRAAGEATLTVRGQAEDVRATELDSAERVAFFRDVLGPVAKAIPLGKQFVRFVDRVDIDDPVGAADGRRVFELHSR